MTKAQRADALLDNARIWQQETGVTNGINRDWFYPTEEEVPGTPLQRRNVAASAALSAASALGYELENADGTPTEKVAVAYGQFAGTWMLRKVTP